MCIRDSHQAGGHPQIAQVGRHVLRNQAQQVVVPVLAVGLCYEVESDVLKLLVYYKMCIRDRS